MAIIGRVARLENSSGRVRRLKALLPSCLESSYPPGRALQQPIKITGPEVPPGVGELLTAAWLNV
jgi:hypothetical protein